MSQQNMFTPYGLYLVKDGKCLLAHHFVKVDHNEHLLTGILSALHILYEEVFHSQLSRMTLNNHKILTQPVRGIGFHLLYTGSNEEANTLLLEILDLMSQQDMLGVIDELAVRDTITQSMLEKFNELIAAHISPDFTSSMESVSIS